MELKNIIVIVIIIALGYYNLNHLENLFENDKFFSHLSELERELSFRTENALYYYYYKQIVTLSNESFIEILVQRFKKDNRTEYPNEINALQRFNLYPEILTGFLYRFIGNFFSRECWHVMRGEYKGVDNEIESCVGLKEPIYFYVKMVFLLNACVLPLIFLTSWYISEYSILTGLFSCLCYMANHSNSTRVMWTPALRESFAYPFILAQQFLLLLYLRTNQFRQLLVLLIVISLVLWQFSQFVLAIQMISVYLAYTMALITKEKLLNTIKIYFISLILSYFLMFLNSMLLNSFYFSILLSIFVLLLIDSKLKLIYFKVALLPVIFLSVKKLILNPFSHDDSHIWDILIVKLITIVQNIGIDLKQRHTFDTLLYTCAKEFDFIDNETFTSLRKSYLWYLSIIASIIIIYLCLKHRIDSLKMVIFFQSLFFTILAVLIMRLKLLMTPQLCILSSLIIKFILKSFSKSKLVYLILIPFLMISQVCYENIGNQLKIRGEYKNLEMESLVNWIQTNTNINASFAGSMSTMANVKLSTNRIIINHPHYEDYDLRLKTYRLYHHIYGRYSLEELHDLLKNEFKVNYLVIESYYCFGYSPSRPECSMKNMVDINNKLKDNKIINHACDLLIYSESRLFQKVYKNNFLFIFKVND